VFVSNHPRPASLSPHHDENHPTARPEERSVTPLAATLRDLPASVANKRLTETLTPLDATLTKNTGVGSPPLSGEKRLASFSRRSDVQTLRRFDGFSAGHQIPAAPLFSYTSELPIFYPLCFDIHPCNGGGCTPLPSIQCAYSPTFDGIRQCVTMLALTPIPALLRLLPNVPTFKPSNVQTILGSPAVYPLLILTKRYPVTIPIHLRYHTSPCPPCLPMSN